jgi:hypothetical protein
VRSGGTKLRVRLSSEACCSLVFSSLLSSVCLQLGQARQEVEVRSEREETWLQEKRQLEAQASELIEARRLEAEVEQQRRRQQLAKDEEEELLRWRRERGGAGGGGGGGGGQQQQQQQRPQTPLDQQQLLQQQQQLLQQQRLLQQQQQEEEELRQRRVRQQQERLEQQEQQRVRERGQMGYGGSYDTRHRYPYSEADAAARRAEMSDAEMIARLRLHDRQLYREVQEQYFGSARGNGAAGAAGARGESFAAGWGGASQSRAVSNGTYYYWPVGRGRAW